MILDRIVAQKRKEISESKQVVSLNSLRKASEILPKGKDFAKNLRKPGEVSLIAEIKKASPSKGLIRSDFNPAEIARSYTEAGAAALSVLTDMKFFQGCPDFLGQAKSATHLPLLRKEFIIDEYQVFEAKVLGADAILLIMTILTDAEASTYIKIAESLKMECLVEVHTAEELARALGLGTGIIGINNRDLRSFQTNLSTTFRLREFIDNPEITVISESGINTRDDVQKLKDHQVHAMLVGEALMREENIGAKVRELLGIYDKPSEET